MAISLKQQTGYIDCNKHGSVLPYINISSPFGRQLKFLIDTGASSSFIDPKFINPLDIEKCTPITISTILNKYNIERKVTLPIFKEIQRSGTFTFLVFKFHGYFDGLLGLDSLTKIGAKIDLENKILSTKSVTIPLEMKPKFSSGKYIITENSKQLVKLPVDVEEGDIIVNTITLDNGLLISPGIYNAKNWFSTIEVVNPTGSDQSIFLEQPIKANAYNSQNFIELNNFNVNHEQMNDRIKNLPELLRTDHLNNEEKQKLFKLCIKYDDIFYREGQNLTFTNEIKHKIQTTDDIPIHSKSYRYPFVHKEEVRTQISDMLEQGIIRPSFSPWSSPVWIVPKKKDASGKLKWRLVIDYRRLNEKTISDRYPLPNISEILDKLGKCLYFSTLDLASGFHQIEMSPQDIPKTAFTVEGGHYEYLRMPFGLKNAPSTFQRVMDNVLRDLVGKICLVYLDDIIIFSTSLQEHIENLEKVFLRLRSSNFKIQLDKSEFLRKEIAFLGHIITTEGIKPNPAKIEAIQKFPIPRTNREIKSFIGLLSYYRKFIPDLAKLTKPLTECLKKGRKITLDDRYVKAFETCKNILMNDPILQFPDFSKPFILTTDASNIALGAILSQGHIGIDKPICYASRTLSESEINYSTIEKELLAIVWAAKYFRPYLFGRKFKIVTDHRPLTWLMSLKEPNSKLVRWRLKLEEYDYEIIYKKGKLNSNADALSRIRLDSSNIAEVNMNASSQLSTIHSCDENLNDGIPISEKPLNEFNLQLLLEKSDNGPNITVETIFKNKQRRTIKEKEFSQDTIIQIFKKFIPSGKLTAISSDELTFRTIQLVYSKYFSNGKQFRIIRCTKILIDITDTDKQVELIRKSHENRNHRGINETYEYLRRQYYFPYMQSIINKTLNNCEICNTLKYDRHPPKFKFQITETPDEPLHILHIDIYTINSKCILTIIDKFSKYAAGYTLPSRTSVCVLKALKSFMNLLGIPKKIVCDQGTEFTSNIFKDFCKQYEIMLHFTSFQQSSSNSPVERLHSTLTEIYRIILGIRKSKKMEVDHEEILDETFMTYNNTIHSSTKFTPYELFFGRPYNFSREIKYNNKHEFLNKLNEFKEKLYPSVREKVLKAKIKNINNLNKTRENPENREVDEEIYRKECRRNKLTPRFSKHKVAKDNIITIQTANNKKLHKSKMKLRKRK